MAAAPSANTAQAIVGVAALTAGVAAATMCQPDKIIDYTISKTAALYVNLCYSAQDSADGRAPPSGFFSSMGRSVSKAVDQTAVALGWKVRVMDFDEKSPVKANQLVTLAVGLAAFAMTRKVITVAMK